VFASFRRTSAVEGWYFDWVPLEVVFECGEMVVTGLVSVRENRDLFVEVGRDAGRLMGFPDGR